MSPFNRIPYGHRARSGRFRCADCGFELAFSAGKPLSPCPLYDDGHSKNCWMPLPEPRSGAAKEPKEGQFPEEEYLSGSRKKQAIDLAMAVISDILSEGAAIRVESHPLSRNRGQIRRQLESLSSGAFVLAFFPNGATEYFDIIYKCQWEIAIMEHSGGLAHAVESGLARLRRESRADGGRPAPQRTPGMTHRNIPPERTSVSG